VQAPSSRAGQGMGHWGAQTHVLPSAFRSCPLWLLTPDGRRVHQVVSVDESGQGIRLFDKPGKSKHPGKSMITLVGLACHLSDAVSVQPAYVTGHSVRVSGVL